MRGLPRRYLPPAPPFTMPNTRICLVRHGETAWNAEQRLQGHEDIPLNEHGRQQARAVARALRDQRFAATYSSDLQRAADTAAAITALHGTSPVLEPGLRERHFGIFQGLTRSEADERYPGEYTRVRMRELDAEPPGGGESLAGFSARVTGKLTELAARHPGADILIVCHGGCLDVIHRMVTGKSLHAARDFPLGNATLNWIAHDDGHWQLLDWDERRHLEASADEIPI